MAAYPFFLRLNEQGLAFHLEGLLHILLGQYIALTPTRMGETFFKTIYLDPLNIIKNGES